MKNALGVPVCQIRTRAIKPVRRIKAVSALLGHSSVSTTSTYYVRDTFSDDELFNEEAL